MAKKKFMQGPFVPKNPSKYMARNIRNIQYRSSWEFSFLNFLDQNPFVLGWASEALSLDYINPLTGKRSKYVPDFIVVYVDKNGNRHCEMIEVKPLKETATYDPKTGQWYGWRPPPGSRQRLTEQTKLTQVVNAAKWDAAMKFCKSQGWRFRVCTENDMFGFIPERKK